MLGYALSTREGQGILRVRVASWFRELRVEICKLRVEICKLRVGICELESASCELESASWCASCELVLRVGVIFVTSVNNKLLINFLNF